MKRVSTRLYKLIDRRPVASLVALVMVLVLGVLGAYFQGTDLALERYDAHFDRVSAERRHGLDLEIARALSIPAVLQRSSRLRALLLEPSAAKVDEQNENLEQTARDLDVDVIYVMNLAGDTLAASNWRQPDSFVGKNYALRPYFQQALAGQTGRYIAKGMTSRKIGYYLARPVQIDGTVRGVVVVKVSLEAIQARVDERWRRDGELTLVADRNGVVVVSPLPALMFKSMQPLAESERRAIESSRQYGEMIIPAPMAVVGKLSEEIYRVRFDAVANQSFLEQSYVYPDLGLQLYLHVGEADYREAVLEFAGMFLLVALLIFVVTVNIYQRWKYTAKLVAAAIRDPLTGLKTRLFMDEWCDSAMRSHDRDPGVGIGLVMIDLDHFKNINDTYGHLAGDEVLREIGAIVAHAIRPEDLAVRFGGEELAIFVRCSSKDEAVALAERVRGRIAENRFESPTGRMPISVSAGVAYRAPGETLDSLFVRADAKLYEAKGQGRNRICS